ncbi:response regulator transcription factor [Novosphingobium sp. KCTC 2891]|uniref:response regulator transcription factor n=1 Tax=Novosphingobium sp. KCTC 2891 TaxID=2989730 RepID=UPI00222287BA|nr:response regulator transcription factor [Novosphingobium sp. KCTC 2891]MCW1381607.1 response regulator transcription factor [Novosphingobium sp. KCTC 2891]
MARKPVVLLLESDVTRRRMMTYNLEVEVFEVLAAESEDDVVARLTQDEIDLALVNWEGFDSGILSICQHFKASGKYVPVLVIAGPEGEEERLAAFRAGVDDIMPKPFSVPELLARIRAILRRTSPDLGGRVIRVSGLNLDVNNGRVSRDGKDIRLSQTEFRILRLGRHRRCGNQHLEGC